MVQLVRTLLLLVLVAPVAMAELTIEITQGRDNPATIAVVPFGWGGTGAMPEDVAAIIDSDLHRSGQFAPVKRSDMLGLPQQQSEVYFRDWRALDVEYLLVGKVIPRELGQMAVQYELFDVMAQKRILLENQIGHRQNMRDAAHAIADTVYEKLTGIPGAFRTKLLYVSSESLGGGQYIYRLLLSDIDGAREKLLREQRQPILTPAWSPDGRTIAYVSFETTRPAIYIEDLISGQRRQLTAFRGLNGAPVWSPDGTKLAMVLSKDGSPDIYVIDVATGQLQRLTRHFAIDTEPSWMPDGKSVIFTSDRGGRPQIYKVALATGYTERLTFEGDYNARARVLPDGSGFVMVHRNNGQYHIAIQDFARGGVEILTETWLDESPSVAPNGTMLIYATLHNDRGIMAAVSVDGGVKYRLPSKFGDVREPAWSPLKTADGL